MTNFTLDKIQLRNVRCYGDEMMEMDFPVNNLTVFTGAVGAGKSTIFKAVSIALYGDDGGAKNEKLTIDDMLNEKNQKNLEIHLYFHSTVDDKPERTEYEIHLYHKHKKYNNKLVFMKDGRDISLESKTATYELIERTLIPKNVYHNVYYFTQQCKNFFTALPNSEQKEIFNAILDLSEYKGYYENAKNKIAELETEKHGLVVAGEANLKNLTVLEENYSRAVTSLEELKKLNNEKIEKLLNYIKASEAERLDIVANSIPVEEIVKKIQQTELEYNKKKSEIEKHIEATDVEIRNLNSTFATKVEALKADIKKERSEKSAKLNDELSRQLLELEQVKSECNKKKSDTELQKTKEDARIRDEFQKKIDVVNDQIRELDLENSEYTSKHNKKVSDVNSKYDNLEMQAALAKNDVSGKIRVVTQSQQTLEVQAKEIQVEIDQNERDLTSNDEVICRYCGNKITNKEHIAKHVSELKTKLEDVKAKVKNAEDQLVKLRLEDEGCGKKIEELKVQRTSELKVLSDELANWTNTYSTKRTTLSENVRVVREECVKVQSESARRFDGAISDVESELFQKTEVLQKSIDNINAQKQTIDDNLREEYRKRFNVEKSALDAEVEKLEGKKNKESNDLGVAESDYLAKQRNLLEDKRLSENSERSVKTLDENILKAQTQLDDLGRVDYYKSNEEDILTKKKYVEDQKDNIRKQKKDLTDLERKLKILEFWKSAFSDSGIKSMLIDSAIPHMNECVTEELERVAPGMFTVSFDTLSETKSGNIRDKFCIHITNNLKGSTGHKKLSGGEKRIIDLCCMTALRSLAEHLYNKRFCHIFYDEILDSLDDSCKAEFCANAKRQSTSGCNVTLITHDMPEDVDPDRTFPF